MSVILGATSANIAFSNSAAENTFYTFTVPANMGATNGNRLKLSLLMTVLNNSGANRTYTARVKFGATTQIDDALIAVPTSAALRTMLVDIIVANDGATNAQVISATVSISGPLAVTSGLSGDWGAADLLGPSTIIATGAIDQTAAQTLVFTLQADAATATQTITQYSAMLELIKS